MAGASRPFPFWCLMFVMKATSLFLVCVLLQLTSGASDGCRYIQARKLLSKYDSGGPFLLDHFRQTNGRTDVRQFLWNHWRAHRRAVAEVKAGTLDRGTVTSLYVIQPDLNGKWGIDVEIDRPHSPPCTAFHADSLVRVRIAKPNEDYPSQTLGVFDRDRMPAELFSDKEKKSSSLYNLVLIRKGKPAGDSL
jgi:hypothetical protein